VVFPNALRRGGRFFHRLACLAALSRGNLIQIRI
jgi:hypothetical protein